MATKLLENVSGRLQTFVLTGSHLASSTTHENRYKPVRRVTVHQARSGQLVPRPQTQALPDSLRLAAGEVREVAEAVVFCPMVRAAIAKGRLKVSDPPKKAAEKQPTTTT